MLIIHRRAVTILITVLCMLGILGLPGVAWGHASLIQSSPEANAVLEEAPERVELTFNEPLQTAFMSIQVTNQDGQRVDTGETRLLPTNSSVMEGDLKTDLPSGVYTIQWRAISADGHRIEGIIPFQVALAGQTGELPLTTTPISSGETEQTRIDLVLIRWLMYLGISMLLGGLVFRLYILQQGWGTTDSRKDSGIDKQTARNRLRALTIPHLPALLWSGYAALTVAVILALPLQVSWDAAVPIAQGFSGQLIGEALRFTHAGQLWFVQVLLLLIISVTMIYAHDREQPIAKQRRYAHFTVVLTLAIMLAKASVGHAAAASLPIAAILADWVHFAAAAFWIGSLSVMLICMSVQRRVMAPEEHKLLMGDLLRGFGGWGIVATALLLGTGVYTSFEYLPSLEALVSTGYGWTLLGKALLMLIMLGIAFIQFRRVRKPQEVPPVGKGIRWELGAGIAVLLLAALLTHLSPTPAPSTTTSPSPVASASFQATQMDEANHQVTLTVQPTRVGSSTLGVTFTDQANVPVEGIQQVTLTLIPEQAERTAQEIIIPAQAEQPFTATEILPVPGNWTIQVHALTASLDSIDAEFTVAVSAD